MREELLLDVPHRQVVFTIPKMLRIFFKFNRRLLGELCCCALRSMARYFEIVTKSELMPGVIAAIQTFGDRINFHPHLHLLVTEGGMDRSGAFHKVPRIWTTRGSRSSSPGRSCRFSSARSSSAPNGPSAFSPGATPASQSIAGCGLRPGKRPSRWEST